MSLRFHEVLVGRWVRDDADDYVASYHGVDFFWSPSWHDRNSRRIENKHGFLRMRRVRYRPGGRPAPPYRIKPRSAAELQRLAQERFRTWTGRELPRNFFVGLPMFPRQNPLDPAYQGISRHLRARVEQAHARWELLDAQTDKLYEQGRLDEAAEVEAEAAIALERLDAMLDEVASELEDPQAEDSDLLARSGGLGGRVGSEMPDEIAMDPDGLEEGLVKFVELFLTPLNQPHGQETGSFLEVDMAGPTIVERVREDVSRQRAEREGLPLVDVKDIPKWQWDGTYTRHSRRPPTEPGDPRGTGPRAIVTVWIERTARSSKTFSTWEEAFKERVRSYARPSAVATFDRAKPKDVVEAVLETWIDAMRRRSGKRPAEFNRILEQLAQGLEQTGAPRSVLAFVRLHHRH